MKSLFHATFSWQSSVVVSFKNSLYIFTQEVADAHVNTCCKLKLVFLEKRLQFSARQYFEIRWVFYIKTESFLTAGISLVHETDKPSSRQQPSCTKTRKELRRCVRRLGTIIQSIFCAQSGAGIRWNFWKWSGESRYPGALSPLLENFLPAFSPDPTDCPWVSEDVITSEWRHYAHYFGVGVGGDLEQFRMVNLLL